MTAQEEPSCVLAETITGKIDVLGFGVALMLLESAFDRVGRAADVETFLARLVIGIRL